MSELFVEDWAPGIRALRLSRPARRNALSPGLIQQLEDALAVARSDGTRVLVLEGEGEQAFCSGYDIDSLSSPGPRPEGELPDDALQRMFRAIEEHPAPSIALVRGAAFGAGCELASACDFRIGVGSAVFCMPPAKLGIVYAPEGLRRVTQLIGLSRAKRMFFTGLRVTASEAYEQGLLDALLPSAEDARASTLALATEMSRGAPLAVSGMKREFAALARETLATPERGELRALRATAFASEDAQEGRAAFQERREAKFRGK